MILRKLGLVVFFTLATAGCQGWSVLPERPAPTPVMDLWKIYSHCQTASDVQSVLRDAAVLNSYAERPEQELPRLLRPARGLISPPVVRLSVDPKAMASACTLRAANAAADAGWTEVATRLYRSLLSPTATDGDRDYYARQAEVGLTDLLTDQRDDMSDTAAMQ